LRNALTEANTMVHGGSMLLLTATAAEAWHVIAGLATYIAVVLWSNRKKFSL
jgi:hypothetical protein